MSDNLNGIYDKVVLGMSYTDFRLAILNLMEEIVPEEKKNLVEGDSYSDGYGHGYNKAIMEIRQRLQKMRG
jgi:hypothetical protein